MTVGIAKRAVLGIAVAAMVAGACGATASGSGRPGSPSWTDPSTAGPTPSLAPRPTPSPTAAAPMTPPPGTSLVEIPAAGIAVPVPDGWQQLQAADLADPAARRDLATTYPGAASILEAIVAAGDRAEVVFLAIGPAGPEADAVPPNIAVLVSQPSVSGLLLDFVTGFIDEGLQDLLDLGEPERGRVDTPVGEAIRLEYAMPAAKGAPARFVAWVIGAPDATLLITTITPIASGATVDPDALISASEVR